MCRRPDLESARVASGRWSTRGPKTLDVWDRSATALREAIPLRHSINGVEPFHFVHFQFHGRSAIAAAIHGQPIFLTFR